MSSRTFSDSPPLEIFWGEITPPEHAVHFYEDDGALLDLLEGFVTSGLTGGETAVVIATAPHLEALTDQLRHAGVSLNIAFSRHRYIPLQADELMAEFITRDGPEEERLTRVAADLLARAHQGSARVRIFSEVTSLLWERGERDVALRVEQWWHRLCDHLDFSTLCAYPKRALRESADDAPRAICETHTKEVGVGAAGSGS
jgi:hypothetical protein